MKILYIFNSIFCAFMSFYCNVVEERSMFVWGVLKGRVPNLVLFCIGDHPMYIFFIKLTSKGLSMSIRIKHPVCRIFLFQSRYQWYMLVENIQVMYVLLIKVYNSISRRFDKGRVFKMRAENAHVDMMVPSVFNLIWSMSSLMKQDN